MNPTGFDTETERFGEGNMSPDLICLTLSANEGEDTMCASVADPDNALDHTIDLLLSQELLVAQNTPYDLGVLVVHRPNLLPVFFKRLIEGSLQDTKTREKLLNLTQFGKVKKIPIGPDGANCEVKYSLADMVFHYFGVDITDDKTASDSWRTNYAELKDMPTSAWPEDAVEYAINDAVFVEAIWRKQEERRQMLIETNGVDPFETLAFRCAVDFALHLTSTWGMTVDAEAKAVIEQQIKDDLSPEKLSHLLASGILIPATPPRPHKRNAKNHVEDCSRKNCDCPVKMTGGTTEKISKTTLVIYVSELCEAKPDLFQLKFTDKGNVSTDAEWMDDYAHNDPLLSEYAKRSKWQKIVTTELPRMCREDGTSANVVHPQYDILKVTGRTSCFASKATPSLNVQNVDTRVRGCFTARPGFDLFSIDYNQMELGTAAQKCLDLFGHSVLAEKINAGIDTHAYLGGQLAAYFDGDFSAALSEQKIDTEDKHEVFMSFIKCFGHDVPEIDAIYKKYRKFAKPTNLGFPGGLGAETFVAYAKKTYEVEVSVEQAKEQKQIWFDTFPEFVEYFEWVNSECIDENFSSPGDIRYAYSSPFGMYRPNCSFCEVANGAALQTPSAEGALMGLFAAVRACYDPSMKSILHDDSDGPRLRVFGFIHDELIGEVRNSDKDLRHELIKEVGDLMTSSMRIITPDVASKVEACLMDRWSKFAEPVFDNQARLDVWTPEKD